MSPELDWGPKAAQTDPKKGPKKGVQRKGTIFIDGPSMDSLMVSINEIIDGNPLIFIDGCPTMNINGFPVL